MTGSDFVRSQAIEEVGLNSQLYVAIYQAECEEPLAAMNVTLHQLRAFEAVIRLGSQTVVAAELGLRPATVSTQVADLERLLGLDLFERIP